MNIKNFLEAIEYKITGGNEYGWMCYGDNAYNLDSWSGSHNGYSFNMIFDTKNQTVYEIIACNYENNTAYRWINPEYVQAYLNEATSKNIPSNQAWDNTSYIPMDEYEIIEVIEDIKAAHSAPTTIELEMTEHEFCLISKAAHALDLTLNQYITNIIEEKIKNDHN